MWAMAGDRGRPRRLAGGAAVGRGGPFFKAARTLASCESNPAGWSTWKSLSVDSPGGDVLDYHRRGRLAGGYA